MRCGCRQQPPQETISVNLSCRKPLLRSGSRQYQMVVSDPLELLVRVYWNCYELRRISATTMMQTGNGS
ncbi:hypothetical protein RSOL_416190 [Rhizoctonia solani AG-3 Rhs1AP]|uniref:Uncharacterized protein n=1 Tax=Rhizoctonia solani AG-3 Rhs1AP TaxID=1086054 RepID=X8JGA2_9AGAM|nr:hypothetical protein RSOL_416190 [Rhizoctonia solani AG-3 Rhs1AP]